MLQEKKPVIGHLYAVRIDNISLLKLNLSGNHEDRGHLPYQGRMIFAGRGPTPGEDPEIWLGCSDNVLTEGLGVLPRNFLI
jgi:hypothetical protein